jgi:dUTP pyrophosphatase
VKYTLDKNGTSYFSTTLYQIWYEDGSQGGWLESERSLDSSQGAKVPDDATVSGNAFVFGDARINGDTQDDGHGVPVSKNEFFDKPQVCLKVLRVGSRGAPLDLPRYETAGSAGLDLRSDVSFRLSPGDRRSVPTGLAIEIPLGYEGSVRSRSGLSLYCGVVVLNSPGTIDSDYRGEVSVILVNHGREPIVFERGERIAQLVISPVVQVALEEVKYLTGTVRGTGGFGSTG